MRAKFLIPFALFLGLAGLLAVGLQRDPRDLPSPLIQQPAPTFHLPRLDAPDSRFGRETMRGKVWLFNVWASWCSACRIEHPVLMQAARRGLIPIIGLNYKDAADDARAWLAREGNPYEVSVIDADGRTGIDYGVYGVPETFLIDGAGVIRYKHTGPITQNALDNILLPKARELSHEP